MSSSSIIPTLNSRPLPSRILNINEIDCPDGKKLSFPKPLIDALIHKWLPLFNSLLKKNKDVQIINTCLDTATFTNCHDVKFSSTYFSYDRLKKYFEINVTPMYHQDILCFRASNRRGMFIRVKSPKLRTLFIKFFEQINKIRFCSDCGNFCDSIHYYDDMDMCETCLFNEINASLKKETYTCSICQEEGKRMFKTNCGHYFHRKCLSKINPNPYPKCPLCRANLDPDDSYMADNPHPYDQEDDDDFFDEDEMEPRPPRNVNNNLNTVST